MRFGEALELMKAGRCLARSGWNGRKMWVTYTAGSVVPLRSITKGTALAKLCTFNHQLDPDKFGGQVTINGHFDMRAADGSLVVGWLASQTDMAAEDWEVVDLD